MDKLWDIVIVGGGLGGLSLAAELAAPQFAPLSILVLEKRTHYTRDRTWSYWTGLPHRYSHLERQRWHRWSVSLGGTVHTQSSDACAYATLDADAFYNAAAQAIHAAPYIELRMDSAVAAIDKTNDVYTVHLQQGTSLQARTVLDARPARTTLPGHLVQQFAGWQVNTQRDVFDTSCVQLMAFEPHARGLHFWYVLPYSPRCALVETTWVSPASWQPDYEAELTQYMAKLCAGTAYTVDYTEQGVLNLQDAMPPSHATHATHAAHATQPAGLGRNGGTLRPATGYAFIDTLHHATQLAQSLAQSLAGTMHADNSVAWQPAAFARPKVERWMDTVFLNVLASDWPRSPEYFMQMFGTVTAQTTVDFLTGKASWSQRLRIMRALPTMPFARAALSHTLGERV
jgi:lycopene beta-cyclase